MQKLAVVYFPQINNDDIDKFKKKYDPGWKIISPHITIVSPISEISVSNLIKHVTSVTKDVECFTIHLTALIKTFDDNLFLQIKEGKEKIVNLHDKLYSGILTSYTPSDFPFVPHLTIGYFRTKNDRFDEKLYAKAYAEAQKLNFNITCTFDEVSVIKGDGLSPAKIMKSIKLQG